MSQPEPEPLEFYLEAGVSQADIERAQERLAAYRDELADG